MTNKILRGTLENEDIEHFRDPKHSKRPRSRKRVRRSIKRKESAEAIRFEDSASRDIM